MSLLESSQNASEEHLQHDRDREQYWSKVIAEMQEENAQLKKQLNQAAERILELEIEVQNYQRVSVSRVHSSQSLTETPSKLFKLSLYCSDDEQEAPPVAVDATQPIEPEPEPAPAVSALPSKVSLEWTIDDSGSISGPIDSDDEALAERESSQPPIEVPPPAHGDDKMDVDTEIKEKKKTGKSTNKRKRDQITHEPF